MISYRPLFKTMKTKNISSYQLTTKMGFSKGKYSNIQQGKGINSHTVNQLCQLLDCRVEDVMEYIPDDNPTDEKK